MLMVPKSISVPCSYVDCGGGGIMRAPLGMTIFGGGGIMRAPDGTIVISVSSDHMPDVDGVATLARLASGFAAIYHLANFGDVIACHHQFAVRR